MSSYTLLALNLYDSLKLKAIRSLLAGKVIQSSPHELQLQYGENSYLFVYRFGCLVFFNIAAEQMEHEIGKVKAALGPGLADPTSETYRINIVDTSPKVEFEYVELKKISPDHLRLVAMTVGQSAALEYFEVRAEKMLYDTSKFMQDLAAGGSLPMRGKKLLKIIGSTASTRQHIISNVSILDPPEETWKSKELGKFFDELQQNFDVELRFRVLDRKLTLVQDNIEILADLADSRRTAILELLVVILIVMELVLAILTKVH